MEENKKVAEAPEKPSYEQLKYWLDKAISDNKQLLSRLSQVSDALNIVPWLFKVVELKSEFDEEFINMCKEGIKAILTPSEPKPEDNSTTEKVNEEEK